MGKYFGTDGVRGRANEGLTLDMSIKIGQYLGWYYGKEKHAKILIGKDTRLSGDMFELGLAAGATSMGAQVYLLGVCPTPAISYLVRKERFDCGIMVSASHNPYYDNGIKCFNHNGEKMEEELLLEVEKYMEKKKAKRKINSSTFLLMITIVLFAVMYIAGMIIFEDKGFAKPQMFMNLFISNAGLIVIGCGMTLVMITGGIDISVGSVTALVCMSAAYAMENKGMSAISAVVISLLIGILFGVVQGYLVTYLEIQPFIVTLAGMFFGRGLTAVISTDMIAIKIKTFLAWANYRINLPFGSYNRRGMFIPAYIYPTVIIALGIVILITIMLKFTKFGRNLYAIGGNHQSAVMMGLNVKRTKMKANVLDGF